MIKFTAASKDRYRASASERRQYGGTTVTEFYVKRSDTGDIVVMTGYGKTPGERKTYAIAAAKKFWNLP